MSELIVAHTSIQKDAEGRYSLNDLHRAAGGEDRHRPSRWAENQQTKDLIAEVESKAGIPALQAGIPARQAGIPALVTRSRGSNPGTFVVKELVYAYAMWISPSFHLTVIRAYDALVTGPANGQRGLSMTQTLAAQKLCVDLAEKLVATTDAGLREVIYSQLAHTSRLLNLPVPPLAALGSWLEMPAAPWKWVISRLNIEVTVRDYPGVYELDAFQGAECLLIRPSQVIPFLMENAELAPTLSLLPVQSPRALRKALGQAGVVLGECERSIDGKRIGHLLALSVEKLEALGIAPL